LIPLKTCPVCDGDNLELLKRHTFTVPQRQGEAKPHSPPTYPEERLRVFFEEIWTPGSPAEIDIDICGSCGMIFSNPRFTAEEIRLKYQTLDRQGSVSDRHRADPPVKTGERARQIRSLIVDSLEGEPEGLRVLDYGGAQGYNLLPFLPENNCFLLDYVTHEYPAGIIRIGNDLEDLAEGEEFDVILACHVLEHSPDPLGLVRGLASHLEAEGLLYVEVPLGAFREWKSLKEPLTHVNFFSEQSIYNCVNRAGMNAIRLFTVFQWVTHSKSWNVVLIARKSAGASPAGITAAAYRRTRRQMSNPAYYVPLVTRRIRRMAGKKD
jgi:SAM-dependent methyltransferase